MYPPEFDYCAAESVADALDLHASHEDAVYLAGGHSLLPDLKRGERTPGTLVDLGSVDALRGVERTDEGLRVGALTTYAALLDADEIDAVLPALADALGHLGDRQIRNRGTVGGNLAQADPGADLPPVALAADATLALRSRDGERTVAAEEFLAMDGGTAREDGELLTAVEFPGRGGSAYAKKTHPASGYALVGVAAVVETADGDVTDARVAASGVTPGAVRLRGVENALAAEEDVEAAAARAPEDVPADLRRGDPHASGEYRTSVLEPHVERALTTARDRATGNEGGHD